MATTRAPEIITDDQIRSFREDGFLHVRDIFTQDEVKEFRAATTSLIAEQQAARSSKDPTERSPFFFTRSVFLQGEELRSEDAKLRSLTFHPRVAAVARALAGNELRLWKAGTLTKESGNRATVIHDDESQYPFTNAPNTLTIWVPMDDVPVERGCLIFLPGSHRRGEPAMPVPDLGWTGDDVLRGWPELAWWPQVTVPIRAGDCTFHHARMVHTATPNTTAGIRIAYAATYIDADATYHSTRYRGPGGDPLGYETGHSLDMFPLLGEGVS